jgi:hypothetical protein
MNNARIVNISRNFSLKHSQALKAVENCACAWVEFGVSIRDLSLAESIAARNTQAKEREPIAPAEIPGLIFQQPASANTSAHERYALIREANQLCQV